jgi:hypothetical protein
MVLPICAGEVVTSTPAACSAAILSLALPLPPARKSRRAGEASQQGKSASPWESQQAERLAQRVAGGSGSSALAAGRWVERRSGRGRPQADPR